jgi:DNA polymerase-4
MPSVTAKRRCPDLIFLKPRFDVYRAVSQQVREIFADYTDLIEPLSLDEAYLDVTEDRRALGSAKAIAEEIRARIRAQTGLTASAGVSYCKFVAKLASDQNKPDGICVIPPQKGAAFVATLPVKRFHGVGPVTAAKMERLGISTGADLARWPIEELEAHFGSSGRWYWRIARGIDEREVKPDRPYKSVSAERTFDVDYSDSEDLKRELARVAGYAWQRIERAQVKGRTVTLKVKFGDFSQVTRSKSFPSSITDFKAFEGAGMTLLDSLLPVSKGIRLLGLGIHSIVEEDESAPRQLGLEI